MYKFSLVNIKKNILFIYFSNKLLYISQKSTWNGVEEKIYWKNKYILFNCLFGQKNFLKSIRLHSNAWCFAFCSHIRALLLMKLPLRQIKKKKFFLYLFNFYIIKHIYLLYNICVSLYQFSSVFEYYVHKKLLFSLFCSSLCKIILFLCVFF